MFARFKFKALRFGLMLWAALIALVAMLTGCDKKVAWRGVGTDTSEARSDGQQATKRNFNDAAPR